jgi:hypothetical protein
MIDIQIRGDGNPQVLADLIASTLHGHPVPDPSSDLAAVGKLVREQIEQAEARRPSREQIETVDFAKIDDETDWSDL